VRRQRFGEGSRPVAPFSGIAASVGLPFVEIS
jgi:hypothetical protein